MPRELRPNELIKKYKTKLQSHRKKDLTTVDMKVHVIKTIDDLEDINDEIEEENLKEDLDKYKIPEETRIPMNKQDIKRTKDLLEEDF